MNWCLVIMLALVLSSARAETITTGNVLQEMDTFTTTGATSSSSSDSGCTDGEFCTGDSTAGGGTYTSQSFNVPLTLSEIQRGFEMNSAVTIDSHQSNSYLSTCGTVNQPNDCRDLFALGITLFEGGQASQSFSHEVELDFANEQSFSFTDVVGPNSLGLLTATLSMWGVDAGYHSSFFGPKFSDPSLTFTYDDLLEQQILEQIVLNDVVAATTTMTDVFVPPPLVEFQQLAPTTTTAPMVADFVEQPSEPPPPQLGTMMMDIPPPPQAQQQEAQAAADIEAQIETQTPEPEQAAPEPEPEPEQAEAEPDEAEAEPNEAEAEPNEAEAEPEQAEAEPEQAEAEPDEAEPNEAEVDAPVRPVESKPKTRHEKIKSAAQKTVAKIAPSQRYSEANQTTIVVAMSLISPKIISPRGTPTDPPGFFVQGTVPDGPSMEDAMQNYVVFARENSAYEAFTQIQWED